MSDALKLLEPPAFIGISQLRVTNAAQLHELTRPEIVMVQSQPVAVLVPYDLFMAAQALIRRVSQS